MKIVDMCVHGHRSDPGARLFEREGLRSRCPVSMYASELTHLHCLIRALPHVPVDRGTNAHSE